MTHVVTRRRFVAHVAEAALALAGVVSLGACGGSGEGPGAADPSAQRTTVSVLAPSSLASVLSALAERFASSDERYELAVSYADAGQSLAGSKTSDGHDFDVYLSASQAQMDELAAADATQSGAAGADVVVPASRVTFATNDLVVAVAEDSPLSIASFDELKEQLLAGGLLLVIGAPDTQALSAAQAFFAAYSLNAAALTNAGRVVEATSVSELTSWVVWGEADAALVYGADARTTGLKVAAIAPAELGIGDSCEAALAKAPQNSAGAQAFVSFLQSAEAQSVLADAGLGVPA